MLFCLDEPSPKKRPRTAVRNFTDVPLVPTHSRTTRFKEIKEKEAKVLEAKKKRRGKGGKRTPGETKKKPDDVDHVIVSVVKDLVDKVHNTDERSHRSKAEIKKKMAREKRSSRRIQEVQQYKELSSEDSIDEYKTDEEKVENEERIPKNDKIPAEIVKTVNELIDSVLSFVEDSRSSNNNTSMKGKLVRVQIVPDDRSVRIADHCRIISACDLVQDSPSKRNNKKRSLSPGLSITPPAENKSDEVKTRINGFLNTSAPSQGLETHHFTKVENEMSKSLATAA